MENTCEDYVCIMKSFINGSSSPEEFQDIFLSKMKGETRIFNEKIYGILDELFGATDSFTRDKYLLGAKPEFYINDVKLKSLVIQSLRKIELLKVAGSH